MMRQTIKKKYFFVLFLFICGFSSSAQKSKIQYIDTKIDVDGVFNEPVWQQ